MYIKNKLSHICKKILYGNKADVDTYVRYLKRIGVSIGDNIEIFSLKETVIDVTNPHLLTIGSNVSMTGPVCILVHDYSVCVTKYKYSGYIVGKQQKTRIGNNIFLGWGCCILPGTVIEDNTIIGAYSVVSGHLKADSVYAGNPGKRICSLQEFYNRRKEKQLAEAIDIYHVYCERYNSKPTEGIFHEYFFLFSSGKYGALNPIFKSKMYDHGNFNESLEMWNENEPMFHSYNEFCRYAEKHS